MRMHRHMKISHRLAWFFTITMTLASICAFFVSSVINRTAVANEIMQKQQTVAATLTLLESRTDLTYDDITQVLSETSYKITKIESLESYRLSGQQTGELESGDPVFLKNTFSPAKSATLVKTGSGYKSITLHAQNGYTYPYLFQTGLTLIFSVIIGTFSIVMMAHRAVRPVLDLKKATQEVSKGNFDVTVRSSRHDEFRELTDNFNKMTHELKGIEHLRSNFISDVSHEFKTPIASILGFAKLLKNDKALSEREKDEYLGIIIEESEKLSNLSTNILKLSKIENQQFVSQKMDFDLAEQIRKTVLLLEDKWGEKQIDFDVKLEKCPYHGDMELLSQVWTNLLDNAVKFTNKKGRIEITAEQTENQLVVTIRDNGMGMSKETQKHIFEKFYQGDKARFSEGNGLGLSLVKKILDMLGGSISVQSKPGKGSCFTVELPKE